MKILDFGAGWKAFYTFKLCRLGLDVTPYDFGRNFDPDVHVPWPLLGKYDVVFASNVLNVHSTLHALDRTVAQLAIATLASGFCVVNYPESPRKLPELTPGELERCLSGFFAEVDRVPGKSCPLWVCRGARSIWAMRHLKWQDDFTPDEIACANIRPVGAVGANALVPRFVLELLGQSLERPIVACETIPATYVCPKCKAQMRRRDLQRESAGWQCPECNYQSFP